MASRTSQCVFPVLVVDKASTSTTLTSRRSTSLTHTPFSTRLTFNEDSTTSGSLTNSFPLGTMKASQLEAVVLRLHLTVTFVGNEGRRRTVRRPPPSCKNRYCRINRRVSSHYRHTSALVTPETMTPTFIHRPSSQHASPIIFLPASTSTSNTAANTNANQARLRLLPLPNPKSFLILHSNLFHLLMVSPVVVLSGPEVSHYANRPRTVGDHRRRLR
jgi:hypothetical protein